MLSGQNYKEFIEQQGQIEKNIAQGWGYRLNPKQYLPKPEKINTNLKVADIEPLRHMIDLPVSKGLQQVQEQLLMLQNERKLNQLTQMAFQAKKRGQIIMEEEECAAIKAMHQCVQEYNFIVEHRHILEKNSERARKILGIQKSESKEIFQKIHSLKEKLGSSTLTNAIKINSQIAKLYKKYSKIAPKSLQSSERLTSQPNRSVVHRTFTSTNNSVSFAATSKFSPNRNSANKESEIKHSQVIDSRTKKQSLIEIKDLMIMQELNESEEGDSMVSSRIIAEQLKMQPQSMLIHHGFARLQRRISQFAPRRRIVTVIDSKEIERKQKKERMNTTIQQAYEKKEIINKGKKFDKTIQQHHDVMEVWKQRINQNKEKNHRFYLKFQAKVQAKTIKSLKNTKRSKQEQRQQDENQKRKFSSTRINYRADEIKKDLAQKEKIISSVLKNKESKYRRIPGTQILQKNDVNQTAKLILGTAKHSDPQVTYKLKTPKTKLKQQQKNSPQWQQLDDNDQKLYWSMCKNQKMNILLRSHKQE